MVSYQLSPLGDSVLGHMFDSNLAKEQRPRQMSCTANQNIKQLVQISTCRLQQHIANTNRSSVGYPRTGVDSAEPAASQHGADLIQLLEGLLLLHCNRHKHSRLTPGATPRSKNTSTYGEATAL